MTHNVSVLGAGPAAGRSWFIPDYRVTLGRLIYGWLQPDATLSQGACSGYILQPSFATDTCTIAVIPLQHGCGVLQLCSVLYSASAAAWGTCASTHAARFVARGARASGMANYQVVAKAIRAQAMQQMHDGTSH